MHNTSKPNWIFYYDGGCNLCHRSQLRIERWAVKAGQPLRVDVLQSPESVAKGYGLEGMILEIDGKPFVGFAAWLELMKVAPLLLRWIYFVRWLPPLRWMAALGYGIVAKYRLKWFGTRECVIPQR